MIHEKYTSVESWLDSFSIKHKYEKQLLADIDKLLKECNDHVQETDSVIELLREHERNDDADSVETGRQEIISRYNAIIDNLTEMIKSVQQERIEMIKAIDASGDDILTIAIAFKRFVECKNWAIIGTEMQLNKSYCNRFKQKMFDAIIEERGY